MRKQQGASVLGMSFIAIIVALMGLLVVQVAPVYMENYSIYTSIKLMDRLTNAHFSDDKSANALAIKDRLINQFQMNGLYNVSTEKLEVLPTEKPNTYVITMEYQVIKPLFYNISLLFKFHESQEIEIVQGE